MAKTRRFPMKLLVTNDDGINSLFLHELVTALRAAGHELFVVAPVNEQSWIGAAKTRARPVKSAAVDRGLGCPTWIVDGTPSDCVNIALAHLLPVEVAAVVSGMNVGMNASLGFVLASGTIGGAWEGALHGLPAFAFSQDVAEEAYHHLKDHGGTPEGAILTTLRLSAEHAARLIGELVPQTPPRSFTVHNINFPFPCHRGTTVRRTVPAHLFVPGLFSPADDDGSHRLIWRIGEDISPAQPLTDRACLAAGHISHTVLDYRRLGHS